MSDSVFSTTPTGSAVCLVLNKSGLDSGDKDYQKLVKSLSAYAIAADLKAAKSEHPYSPELWSECFKHFPALSEAHSSVQKDSVPYLYVESGLLKDADGSPDAGQAAAITSGILGSLAAVAKPHLDKPYTLISLALLVDQGEDQKLRGHVVLKNTTISYSKESKDRLNCEIVSQTGIFIPGTAGWDDFEKQYVTDENLSRLHSAANYEQVSA
ncbi:hypothetical protein [Streptomyces sp. NPDC006012]|uniref:hypothetical protein n=1 Tax=Streptomyces sp. NPDC006012 TaxID=3364739 RepID=UPI0036B7F6BF